MKRRHAKKQKDEKTPREKTTELKFKMASFRIGFFRFFALKFRLFAWCFFCLFAWRFFLSFCLFAWRIFAAKRRNGIFSSFRAEISSFRVADLAFSHSAILCFRLFAWRLFDFSRGDFSPQKDGMAQTGHHKLATRKSFYITNGCLTRIQNKGSNTLHF